MALQQLLDIEIGVADPELLDGFYREIGLVGGKGAWGSADLPGQIRIVEAPYRQLRSMRVACESERDLERAARKLDALGIKARISGTTLRCTDPVNKWDVIVETAEAQDISPQPVRLSNRPGERGRIGQRAEVIVEATPRPPRRLGHVVVGSPDPIGTRAFFEALGYRVSDVVAGIATFMRCSPDHHNLLVAPGEVPYLNHYALEHDDFDAVARAATLYLREHDGAQIAGPGRHQIGGNQFWYMRDPSGTFFEFFSDMDRILDDEAWEIRSDWDLADSWSVWGQQEQPEVFFRPEDMNELVSGWNAAHG